MPFISYVIVFTCLLRMIDGLDTFSVATTELKLPRSISLRMLSIMCASVSKISATSGFTAFDTLDLAVLCCYYYYRTSNVLNNVRYLCELSDSSISLISRGIIFAQTAINS